MATRSTHNARNHATTQVERVESPKEVGRDIAEYLTQYARDNPAHAALACLGVGFILGWKLKPW